MSTELKEVPAYLDVRTELRPGLSNNMQADKTLRTTTTQNKRVCSIKRVRLWCKGDTAGTEAKTEPERVLGLPGGAGLSGKELRPHRGAATQAPG